MALLKAYRNLLRLFLRPVCPGCGGARADGEKLCSWCMLRLEPCRSIHLSSTGASIRQGNDAPADNPCNGVYVHSALMYRGLPGEMVVRLKFGGESHLASVAAWLIKEYSTVLPSSDELLVPVPTGPSKRRKRGYSQASLIAARLAPLLECSVLELLERDDGPSQVGLPLLERRSNVRGVFRLKRGAAAKLAGRHGKIWLVDDVATTCSTIHNASLALSEVYADSVSGLTLTYRGRSGGSIV